MSSGCKCGSNCSCGDNCNCQSGTIAEKMTTQAIILGVAPMKINYEGSEMGFGEESGCKCGSNCSCDNCSCK